MSIQRGRRRWGQSLKHGMNPRSVHPPLPFQTQDRPEPSANSSCSRKAAPQLRLSSAEEETTWDEFYWTLFTDQTAVSPDLPLLITAGTSSVLL